MNAAAVEQALAAELQEKEHLPCTIRMIENLIRVWVAPVDFERALGRAFRVTEQILNRLFPSRCEFLLLMICVENDVQNLIFKIWPSAC